MKLRILAAALALCSAAASAQDNDGASFRAHLNFLGNDLLEGRDTGSRGFDIAAQYVASQFELLGLQPGSKSGWFQEVPFVQSEMTGEPGAVTVGGARFVHGKDILIGQNPVAGRLDFEAPAVFAGYGIVEPKYRLDDYAGLDVRGKIVVMLSGMPEGLPSDVAAHLAGEKAAMAAARGAVGIIFVQSKADMKRYDWDRVVQLSGGPGLTWLQPDGQPFLEAPGLRFSATFGPTAAAALFAGARRPLDRIRDEAVGAARPKGFPLPARIRITRDSINQAIASRNVVGFVRGSDPALANEYVAFTAHVDGIGLGKDGSVRAGAVDNAAGVAAMLEAARMLATAPTKPRRGVLFVALTGEEKGLLGAQYLARNPVRGGRMVGLVNLDTLILTYDFTDLIGFGAEHTTLGPVVASVAKRNGLSLIPDPLPEEGIFTRSDHYEFVRMGVPSVFLLTGFGNGGEEKFKSYLARTYHTPDDDLNLPYDWKAAARFSQLNYQILREMADAPEAPRWNEGSYFGDVFAKGQPKARVRK